MCITHWHPSQREHIQVEKLVCLDVREIFTPGYHPQQNDSLLLVLRKLGLKVRARRVGRFLAITLHPPPHPLLEPRSPFCSRHQSYTGCMSLPPETTLQLQPSLQLQWTHLCAKDEECCGVSDASEHRLLPEKHQYRLSATRLWVPPRHPGSGHSSSQVRLRAHGDIVPSAHVDDVQSDIGSLVQSRLQLARLAREHTYTGW